MKEIKHGFLGKYHTYKKVGYEEPKQLTPEERAEQLAGMMKPWKFEAEKIKPLYQLAMGAQQQGTPTPSPTPSSTPAPSPSFTPTPTPTPSATPPPSFNPASFGGLQLWFDASDTDTLTLQSGNTYDDVLGWQSKGLIDVVLSAESINRAPYYYTNAQNNPAVVLSTNQTTPANSVGIANFGEYSMPLTSGYTAFVFAHQPNSAGTNILSRDLLVLIDNDNTTTNGTYGQNRINLGTIQFQDYMRTGTTTGKLTTYIIQPTNSAYTNTTTYTLWGGTMQYTGNTLNPLASETLFSGTQINSSPTAFGFGYDTGFSGKTIDGFGFNTTRTTGSWLYGVSNSTPTYREVNEVLFYDKILTQSQVDQVVEYLNNKWTISASTEDKIFLNYEYTGFTQPNSANAPVRLNNYATGFASLLFWYDTNGRAPIGYTGETFLFATPSTMPAGKVLNFEMYDEDNNLIYSEYDKGANYNGNLITLTASTYNAKLWVSDEPTYPFYVNYTGGTSTDDVEIRNDAEGGVVLLKLTGDITTAITLNITANAYSNLGVYYDNGGGYSGMQWNSYVLNACDPNDIASTDNTNFGRAFSNSINNGTPSTCYRSDFFTIGCVGESLLVECTGASGSADYEDCAGTSLNTGTLNNGDSVIICARNVVSFTGDLTFTLQAYC